MNSGENSTFRQLYLKHLVGALNDLKKPTSRNEEEVAGSSRSIKLAANVSLALTANRAAWSRALLNRISSDAKNRPALRKILGPKNFRAIITRNAKYQSRLILQSKLKQARMQHRKTCHGVGSSHSLSLYRFLCSKRTDPATSSHARLVKKRTRQLQRLVPGGNSMDTPCLLKETADYITSLTTQVDVLQSLLNSVNNNQYHHTL